MIGQLTKSTYEPLKSKKITVTLCAILCIGMISLLTVACGPPPKKADSTETETGPKSGSRVKAEAGVGLRGQKLKGRHGVLSTYGKTLFNVEQRLAFMNAEKLLQMHRAQFDWPKNHEAYMQMLKDNQFVLPELPEGDRYEYDPKTHELMVVTE